MLWMCDQRHLGVDQTVKYQSRRQSIRVRFDRNACVDPFLMKFVENILVGAS